MSSTLSNFRIENHNSLTKFSERVLSEAKKFKENFPKATLDEFIEYIRRKGTDVDKYEKGPRVPLGEVVSALTQGLESFEKDGFSAKLKSLRIKTYLNGTDCKHCGAKGMFFEFNKHVGQSSYHLNLYGVTSDGEITLMTSDHIVSKGSGGSDKDLSNRQCLCIKCNARKGNKTNEEALELAKANQIN